ncbi:choice-of-anchor P family protein [Streptomyces sp. NPDC050095]|uniref:choice-of-anchor P family protein n=1 Tax=unclassified Streptomyces TaxID=2593676 RepID=UPI00342F2A4F
MRHIGPAVSPGSSTQERRSARPAPGSGGTITRHGPLRSARTNLRRALLACAATAALTAGSLGAAHADTGGDRHLTYQGRTFTVPGSWDVIDLGTRPDTCVRFDRHAVYLGTPDSQQDCPAMVLGRTEALLLQPVARTRANERAARVTTNRTDHTYEATAPGLAVTASYGGDRQRVEKILSGAGLPVASATPAATVRAGAPTAKAALPDDATSFQGKGFDRCAAPSTTQMNAWKGASPYGAVGVYIGGVNAGCGVTVDAAWMQAQYTSGWKYFPVYVGPQASSDAGSCGGTCDVIDDPAADGAASARDAVRQATSLGLPAGSVLYYNMEHYAPRYGTLVRGFLESWTRTVHDLGYRSGAYGSLSSIGADLVRAAQSGQLVPDVLDFAKWDDRATTDDPAIPAELWADHQRIKQYAGDVRETHGGVSLDIDANQLDVGAGGTQPPVQKDTALAYTGARSVANGTAAALSAKLTEQDGGAAIADREIAFTLGAGSTAQSCTATTGAEGTATCTVPSVDQPLTERATVPVAAAFAGDTAYKPSQTQAELKLQYTTARAYGLAAKVPLPLLPLTIAPTPDTGEIRTAGATTTAPPCTASVTALVLSADAVCATTVTRTGPTTATATANLADARIGIAGLPVIAVSGLEATATSTCAARTGSTTLTLTVAGAPVTVPSTPNHTIDLGVAKLVTNQQTSTADGIEVTALHLTGPTGIDVTLGSARSAVHNCPA